MQARFVRFFSIQCVCVAGLLLHGQNPFMAIQASLGPFILLSLSPSLYTQPYSARNVSRNNFQITKSPENITLV